ncbi:MAG: UDP-N-acetylmuramoyl-L-alanine--D-glutamate ligase [Ruthenibacterium sp.]
MTEKIADFYTNLQGKKVAFIGTGVTNQTCIELFAKHGAQITLCDKKPNLAAFGKLADTLKTLGIAFSLGDDYLTGLQGQDMVMRTPGFEYFTPELQAAKAAGAEVTSEMELFFTLCPCKIVAVTGSDGKTTTSTLIAKMLEAGGYTVHLGGNLGRALLPVAEYMAASDIAVVELSSFQLISMRHSPDIAVVTNVSPNHLDHHKDMQEYVDAKRNILLYQTPPCKAVLGYANEITRGMQADVKGTMQWFTRFSAVENGGFLRDDGMLCIAENGVITPIVHRDDIALRGDHNIENMLAAFCAVWTLTTPPKMAKVARHFAGVEHRIEPVRRLNGVQWYNDSIATSPTRVIAGLRAFGQKLIIIAGGSDKGISFTPMVPDLLSHVKILILTGATADKIEAAVREHADFPASHLQILRAADMDEAVKLAYQTAKDGDIVSLSPACASFDSYPNFEVRGNHYKALVNAL